jgi:hypothetical protein
MDQINEEKLQEQVPSEPVRRRRRAPFFLIALIIILAAVLGYLIYENQGLYKDYVASQQDKAELERIKNNLEGELRNIYLQYDSLKTENDTINEKLAAEQQKIERLLKLNANNVYKIHLYEKELETIRQVLRSYVVQIDSLNQANIALRTENVEVRQKLRKVQKESENLTKEKNELTEKVELASVLSAKNIIVTGLNNKGKERTKSKAIEKLRVCFTLRENAVLPTGEKIIYIRIARPDEVILTSGLNFFEYEGEQIVYSASREVDYQNVDIDMCIYWTNDGQLIEGTYQVNIFADGKNIGSTSFVLK